MRSRLQLACQLLFLSTIASSAQTPPRTTDATINENQSVEDTVEDWFFDFPISNYLEEAVEDTMTLYQTTVGEAWKYPMEGSSDANQSVEDMTAMYQHATAETTRPLTIDATWTLDEEFNYAKEVSSFQTTETNNVPLDYQNTVEANQAQTIQAWLDQEQATVDVDAPSMLAMHVSAVNTRNAPPTTGRCHSCNISESPYWCSGPDGACTLCNLCDAEESNFWKTQALAEYRLERSIEKMPTSHFDVSHSALAKYGNVASSSTSPHESGLTLPRLEDTMTLYPHPTAEANIHPTADARGADKHQATVGEAWNNPTEGSSDGNQSVEASMEGGTAPPMAEVNHHRTIGATSTDEHQAALDKALERGWKASSAQTPPTTTDVTINENQSVEDSVQDWFFNFDFLEEDVEDTMTLYPHPMAEANIHPTVDATGTDEHQATVGEAWKYPTEGSSDANQSVEASVEDGTTPPTAEVNHHRTIGATSTDKDQDKALEHGMESSSDANQSFEASVEDETSRCCYWCKVTSTPQWRRGADGVRLCNACGKAWLKNGVLPSGGMWRMRRHRIVPPASGMCIQCETTDVQEWHRGPDNVSNYCKKCGDRFSTFRRKYALAQEKNAGLKRFERSNEQMPFDVSDQVLSIEEAWKEELTARKERKRVLEEKKANQAEKEGKGVLKQRRQPNQNFVQGSSDANQSVEASVEDGTTMYQPPTAEANHHHTMDAFKYAATEDISDANQSVEASVEDGTTMFQHATAGLIAASNFPGIPTLQTKSPRPLSKHREAIRSRKRRAETNRLIAASNFPGIPTLQTKSPKHLSTHPGAIRTRKRYALETPEERTARYAKGTEQRARDRLLTPQTSRKTLSTHPKAIYYRERRALETPQKRAERQQADANRRKAARRARVQEPNQIEGESSQKKRKS